LATLTKALSAEAKAERINLEWACGSWRPDKAEPGWENWD